jgi:cytochrome oxidase assembly protein ShyY1
VVELKLRETVRTLRQPRYAALTALMIVVALACVGAGTWQIVRFEQKVHANDELSANARAAARPLDTILPLVPAAAPSDDAIRYRTVEATGTYDARHQGLVRLRSVNDTEGFYVLTPLRSPNGTVLVVRGFVAARANGDAPSRVAAPPAGPVTVRARVEPAETRNDRPSGLPADQLASINPIQQSAQLGGAVYNGYVTLLAGQPGTSGLTAIPAPDLSNPAGGAVEPQHFAYIIQWYLFAILALAAPLAMSRAERRERTEDVEGVAASAAPELSDEERRAAKLADRYGRAVHQ